MPAPTHAEKKTLSFWSQFPWKQFSCCIFLGKLLITIQATIHVYIEFLKLRTWKSTPASFRNIHIYIYHYSTSPLPGENKKTATVIHCYIALITLLFMFFDVFCWKIEIYAVPSWAVCGVEKDLVVGDWGLHLVQDKRNNQKHHWRVHHPQPCNRWINNFYLLVYWRGQKYKNLHFPLFTWCGVYGPNITPPKKVGSVGVLRRIRPPWLFFTILSSWLNP